MASDNDPNNTLSKALKHFETAEANLVKLEKIWKEISESIPDHIEFFSSNYDYEDKCRAFKEILPHLPKINGWRPDATPYDLNEIAQGRLDAQELGEITAQVSIDEHVNLPEKQIRKYRFLLNKKRKELTREFLIELIDSVDSDIRNIKQQVNNNVHQEAVSEIYNVEWNNLQDHVAQIDTLLGSSSERPKRWSDLHRHLHFGQLNDFSDIKTFDWPVIKKFIRQNMYEEEEPLPSEIESIDELIISKPSGQVTRELNWSQITEEQFERLIFSLINTEHGYQNSQWLTKTNAPDKGRDLSVERIIDDPLSGTSRLKTIIQCRHWLSRSVSVDDVSKLKAQMELWTPPRVDVHIIATSGRFTTDAISYIEKHNDSDHALRIEMWPETHLEMLLASRPHLIAEFGLR